MTPAQCRAARALINWSTQQLASQAEVGVNTVNRFEGGQDARMSSVGKYGRLLNGRYRLHRKEWRRFRRPSTGAGNVTSVYEIEAQGGPVKIGIIILIPYGLYFATHR